MNTMSKPMNDIKKLLLPFLLLLGVSLPVSTSAQSHEYVYKDLADSTHNSYLKIIPKGAVKGILVFPCTRLTKDLDSERFTIHRVAQKEGILTLFIALGKLEFYFDDQMLQHYDEIIHEVMEDHNIPSDKLVMGGLSTHGHGAMKYSMFCLEGKSKYGIMPAAAFAVDAPLDYARLWRECEHAIERNFHKGTYEEGVYVTETFRNQFGGSPEEYPEAYKKVSVYSHGAPEGGNAKLLKSVPVRFYIDPDINWYITFRGKDYCDINSADAAGIVNELRHLGNDKAELVVRIGEGHSRSGDRDPHSYTIMDHAEAVTWMLQYL